MTPYERILARAAAQQVLNLGEPANAEQTKSAHRRPVSERHTDRSVSRRAEIEESRVAYETLQSVTQAAMPRETVGQGGPVHRRPALKTRIVDLSAETRATCRRLLEQNPGAQAGEKAEAPRSLVSCDRDAEPATRAGASAATAATDHVPEAVSRRGRELTFLVSNPLASGVNRVAMPTDLLTGSRQPRPRILTFDSHDTGSGQILVPDGLCKRMFPGARRVRIRFVGGKIERPGSFAGTPD